MRLAAVLLLASFLSAPAWGAEGGDADCFRRIARLLDSMDEAEAKAHNLATLRSMAAPQLAAYLRESHRTGDFAPMALWYRSDRGNFARNLVNAFKPLGPDEQAILGEGLARAIGECGAADGPLLRELLFAASDLVPRETVPAAWKVLEDGRFDADTRAPALSVLVRAARSHDASRPEIVRGLRRAFDSIGPGKDPGIASLLLNSLATLDPSAWKSDLPHFLAIADASPGAFRVDDVLLGMVHAVGIGRVEAESAGLPEAVRARLAKPLELHRKYYK